MIDPKEATATLRLSLHNPQEKLKPGMYVKVHATTESKNRLVIPRTAVIRKNGTWYAFLATEFNGEYEPVKIENPAFSKYSSDESIVSVKGYTTDVHLSAIKEGIAIIRVESAFDKTIFTELKVTVVK